MARYADSLLAEGEVVVLRTRQHFFALLARARAGIALFVLGLALLIIIAWFKPQGLTRDVLSWAALALLLIGFVLFLARFWIWWAQDYMITNRRMLKVTGVLSKRSADSSLEKINDAVLSQSVFGRMFNFGDLEILTAAEQAVDRYHMIKDPKGFKKTMLTQKHNLETEFMYGRPPTPPLRADAQPAAPTPQMPVAPAPAPAAATPAMPAEDDSREVTETLARLADLRDKGAITAEEFEQKKDELLGRL
ncbi:MAG: PH domain-containing protein [Chloroflexota bacterium]